MQERIVFSFFILSNEFHSESDQYVSVNITKLDADKVLANKIDSII